MSVDDLLYRFRFPIGAALVGLILIGTGILVIKGMGSSSEVQILGEEDIEASSDKLIVEVSGSVNSPGVYELYNGSRIEDAINRAGGMSDNANLEWVEKTLNRAAKILDGQKIYIPSINEQSDSGSANNLEGNYGGLESSSGDVNINSASQNQLESLWGIGPVTAQNIIEQRPYSSVEDLLVKKVLKQNVYDRNKDRLTVY